MRRIHAVAVAFVVIVAGPPGCERDGGAPPAALDAAGSPEETSSGVWICLDCDGIVAAKAGACSRCAAELAPIEVELTWTCLKHPVIVRRDEGLCAICERALKPIAMAVVWRCPDHGETRRNRGGPCAECGFPLEEALETLPHGDHNPRHGGQFFMAPDLWHHLEGALPAEGEFRVYLYDDFTRPLPAERARGRVEVRVDGRSGDRAPGALPLRAGPGGEWLVASIPAGARGLPIDVTAFLEFTSSPGEEHRFDFRFEALTVEEERREGAVDALAQELGAPDTAPPDWTGLAPAELLGELEARDRSLRQLIERKRWQDIYLPAMEAKDIALAMEREGDGEGTEGEERESRERLERAVRDVVRGAWLMELHGDAGNGPAVEEAHVVFTRGVEGLRTALSSPPAGPRRPPAAGSR